MDDIPRMRGTWKMNHQVGRGYATADIFRLEEERFWFHLED